MHRASTKTIYIAVQWTNTETHSQLTMQLHTLWTVFTEHTPCTEKKPSYKIKCSFDDRFEFSKDRGRCLNKNIRRKFLIEEGKDAVECVHWIQAKLRKYRSSKIEMRCSKNFDEATTNNGLIEFQTILFSGILKLHSGFLVDVPQVTCIILWPSAIYSNLEMYNRHEKVFTQNFSGLPRPLFSSVSIHWLDPRYAWVQWILLLCAIHSLIFQIFVCVPSTVFTSPFVAKAWFMSPQPSEIFLPLSIVSQKLRSSHLKAAA